MGHKEGSWLTRLRSGLAKSRNNLSYQIKNIWRGRLDEESWEELEELLIGADIGVKATEKIISDLKSKLAEQQVYSPEELNVLLKSELIELLRPASRPALDIDNLDKQAIILFIGVNGTGKTTTIGKLAARLRQKGRRVTLVAADTFRAAAIEQLEKWAVSVGVDLIKQHRGADAAAVVYDAVHSQRSDGILLVDTAGRLHTNVNLLSELKKIKRVIKREAPERPVYTLLVIDATTGQNGIRQAEIFHQAMDIDGLALTKLDGTAKGGIALAVQDSLGVPIILIGVGEKNDDLNHFNAENYVEALLD